FAARLHFPTRSRRCASVRSGRFPGRPHGKETRMKLSRMFPAPLILAALCGLSFAQTGQSQRTGAMRATLANEHGNYVLAALQPAVYTVKASAQAFATAERKGFQLLVGE